MEDKSAASHHSRGYGHGPNRSSLSGMAHLSDLIFNGKFPIAEINHSEPFFTGK